MQLDLQTLLDEKQQLLAFVSRANAFLEPDFAKKTKRLSELDKIIELAQRQKSLQKQLLEAQALAAVDDELAKLAESEIPELQKALQQARDDLLALLTPRDPNDNKDIIMEIRAGAGGDEASLFAADLYRMYVRLAEMHGFKAELISESPSDVGGYKEIIFAIKGQGAYSLLKFESGVHRVQRIPSTESSGRIHTSTVTVAVLPEAEESEIAINPADLRIDVYRSSGHGGQSVNTTDSAVRLTHLPSGIVVTCQDEKSQLKNKDKAMSVLRSRLLAIKLNEEQQKLALERRSLIGTGERAEKIRAYNFPQDRITDHRTGFSRNNLEGALSGNIDDLLKKLQTHESELRALGSSQ